MPYPAQLFVEKVHLTGGKAYILGKCMFGAVACGDVLRLMKNGRLREARVGRVKDLGAGMVAVECEAAPPDFVDSLSQDDVASCW